MGSMEHEHFLYCQRTGWFGLAGRETTRKALGGGCSGYGASAAFPQGKGAAGAGCIPCGVWYIHRPIDDLEQGRTAFRLSPAEEAPGGIAILPRGIFDYRTHWITGNPFHAAHNLYLPFDLRQRLARRIETLGIRKLVVATG